MKFSCFVTGTDTGVGKTAVTLGLMQAFRDTGMAVAGMKPVASGSTLTATGLRNDDALHIQALCSMALSYEHINPYALPGSAAPHIAAAKQGINIQPEPIVTAFSRIIARSDAVIVEGAGGWRVPISEVLQTVDLVKMLNLPVILVVGLRLGCINHALLTTEVIANDGLAILGWVANTIQTDYPNVDATISAIEQRITAPVLGRIPYLAGVDPASVARFLDIELLFPGKEKP